jgi:hypothetical protein
MDGKLSHFYLFFYFDLPGPIWGGGLMWRELVRPVGSHIRLLERAANFRYSQTA